ncbi:MAG: DUF2007 domain-containing protein [Candidatus Rokubacteria bacterium]|nr:DUF2007 domain-containing protein [Candidatus Rokubacteria bacterium]
MARKAKVIRFPGRQREPDGSRTEAPSARQDERSFVEVHRCRDQAEALVLKGLLESEGIQCLLQTRLAHSVHPFTVGDQGEVIVQVAAPDARRARLLIARGSAGPSFP